MSGSAFHASKNEENFSKKIKRFILRPAGFNEYLDIKKMKEKNYYLDFPTPLCGNLFIDSLEGFLSKGSFPELYNIEDKMLINQYIKTLVVEKIIFEDIPALRNLKHLQKLLEVYNFLAYHSGDFVYEKSFSEITGLSEPTIDSFFANLEDFHLFHRVYTSSNVNKKIKRKKKVFLESASLYSNTSANFSSTNLYSTAVYEKLKSFDPSIYYDNQLHEVDFVLKINNRLYPFMVKAVEIISPAELKNLVFFLKKNNLTEGYLIYKGLYKVLDIKDKKIFLIPLSSFLASEIKFS